MSVLDIKAEKFIKKIESKDFDNKKIFYHKFIPVNKD